MTKLCRAIFKYVNRIKIGWEINARLCSLLPSLQLNNMCVLFLVSVPVEMPELWGGVGYNRSSVLPRLQPRIVASPALDSGCPTRIHLSPMIRSNMHANDNGRVNGYIGNDNRQRAKYRHGGTNYFIEWDSHLPCLWHEGPCSSLPKHPKIPLPRSMRICYCAWACTLVIFPSGSFLGFRNCGLESVTPNMGNTEVSQSKPLAHAGTLNNIY